MLARLRAERWVCPFPGVTGLPKSTVALTVNKVCASGMKSVALAAQSIMLVGAGGQWSLSSAMRGSDWRRVFAMGTRAGPARHRRGRRLREHEQHPLLPAQGEGRHAAGPWPGPRWGKKRTTSRSVGQA